MYYSSNKQNRTNQHLNLLKCSGFLINISVGGERFKLKAHHDTLCSEPEHAERVQDAHGQSKEFPALHYLPIPLHLNLLGLLLASSHHCLALSSYWSSPLQ